MTAAETSELIAGLQTCGKLAVKVKTAAELLDLDRSTVSRLISAGMIRKNSIGLIPIFELQRYLEESLEVGK